MENITTKMAHFVRGFSFEQISEDALETMKMYIADYYAALFAGYRINEPFNQALREIMEEQWPEGKVIPAFHSRGTTAEQAAYLNAAYSHGADMDDGNKKAMGHIAAHVMSSVFALAQTMDASWKEVITALMVGYEIFNRLAGAAQPGIVRRGFHSTGVAGAVASAAACAKLMGLKEEQIYSAISMAAVQSGGLLIITESGQACKPLNPANAARTGIFSARLASKGIEGSVNPLESKKGWFHAFSETYSEEILMDALGEKLTIQESYLKPYASCRHTHCGIECALTIRAEMEQAGAFVPEKIAKVELFIYPNAITVAGNVLIPASDDQTKFSLHYSLAAALLNGRFGFQDLTVDAVTENVKTMIGKIEVHVDETMENTAKKIRGCRVNVIMEDGTVFACTVLAPKGEAENPFTWEDISAKLHDCAGELVPGERCDFLLKQIREINPDTKYKSLF